MNTDFILQGMRVAEIDQQRLQRRLQNEQLRIARMSRPSLTTRIAQTIGLMLIATGERLGGRPAPRHGSRQGKPFIPRAI